MLYLFKRENLMFLKEIVVDNQTYPIEINYAKVNGIIVRINPIGKISIKANPRYNLDYIENYLFSIEPWIKSKQKNILKNMEILAIDQCLNHQKIWLFGKLLQIKEHNDLTAPYYINDDTVFIPPKNIRDGKYLKAIRADSSTSLETLVQSIKRKLDYKKELRVEFKYFSSKWGVCYPKKNIIILNERLCHLPLELIELVIVHELIHLKVPNHSKSFYAELAIFSPHYKKLQNELKRYSFILMKEY